MSSGEGALSHILSADGQFGHSVLARDSGVSVVSLDLELDWINKSRISHASGCFFVFPERIDHVVLAIIDYCYYPGEPGPTL